MKRSHSLLLRASVALTLVAATAGGGAWHIKQTLPQTDAVARGVRVRDIMADGEQSGAVLAASAAEALLDKPLNITLEGKPFLTTTGRELGATVTEEAAAEALDAVARQGSWWQRYDEARQAAAGHRAVALPLSLPASQLLQPLAELKDSFDRGPRASRWDFKTKAPTPHGNGRSVDVHATIAAVYEALLAGESTVAVQVDEQHPHATSELVAKLNRSSVVSDYTTRFGYVGNQVGRAQNVQRAAGGINGLVMMPKEVISFNDLVGPRSIDNGFAPAGEIYKGEMRMGIGGGTCQVASTFHAAAYLGGLEVVQRSPHSRPSGYIGVGLDATVAYPHVDLRMRNPFDFPILVKAEAIKGEMHVTLYGGSQPANVAFSATTVGIKKYKRKVRTAHWLPEGKTFRKQKGRRGMTIEKVRRIQYTDGHSKVETTTDIYPPTNEVYYVAPDVDVETSLPPLPEDATG